MKRYYPIFMVIIFLGILVGCEAVSPCGFSEKVCSNTYACLDVKSGEFYRSSFMMLRIDGVPFEEIRDKFSVQVFKGGKDNFDKSDEIIYFDCANRKNDLKGYDLWEVECDTRDGVIHCKHCEISQYKGKAYIPLNTLSVYYSSPIGLRYYYDGKLVKEESVSPLGEVLEGCELDWKALRKSKSICAGREFSLRDIKVLEDGNLHFGKVVRVNPCDD